MAVHRVEQRGVVGQADCSAEEHLRGEQHRQVGGEQNQDEATYQGEVTEQQPTKTIMPAGPEPEADKSPKSGKTPDRTRKPGQRGRKLQAQGYAGHEGNQGIHADISEGIGQPGHAQETPGPGR